MILQHTYLHVYLHLYFSLGICDGAGAVVLANEEAINKHNLTPLARLVDYTVGGIDPSIMGIGPAPAIKQLLEKQGLSLDQIDLVEASSPMICD